MCLCKCGDVINYAELHLKEFTDELGLCGPQTHNAAEKCFLLKKEQNLFL